MNVYEDEVKEEVPEEQEDTKKQGFKWPKLEFNIFGKIRDKVIGAIINDTEFLDSLSRGIKDFVTSIVDSIIDAIFDSLRRTIEPGDDE